MLAREKSCKIKIGELNLGEFMVIRQSFSPVSRGQSLFLRRGVIACSISAQREKGSGIVHRCYLFLKSLQIWGVLIDSDVDIAYVLLHFLLSKCTLLRTEHVMY